MYWNSLNEHLKKSYGTKVYKLALSSGCSCPNRDGTLGSWGCTFCDGSGTFAEVGPIPEQIAAAKLRVAEKTRNGAKYIAYFQSFTNTYGTVERLEPLYRQAMEPEDVVALSIATRPDCLPKEMLALLGRLNAVKPVWVELGLQTMHPETAKRIGRGYELPVFEQAVRELKQRGITVIVHQILGLPGETAEQMIQTAQYIGQIGADGVKFHLLHILRGTELAEQWRKGEVQTLEMDAYIAVLEDCVRHIPRDMVIHRLTGDGAKRDLLAPLWSGDKKRVLNGIHTAFVRDDVEQGSGLS